MALQRLVVIFGIGSILLLGLDARSKHDQSQIYGKQGPNDKLAYREQINLGFWRDDGLVDTYEKNVTYPTPPAVEGVNLTCIKVLDQMMGGQNSLFWFLSGGVGYKNASLRFAARPGYPIMYIVEFYGPP